MTWKHFKDEKEAKEMYDKEENKAARMLCKYDEVISKEGAEELTNKMEKYAE